MNSWEDQDRFVMSAPKPTFQINATVLLGGVFGFLCWSGIAWFFVWAAVGGWRTFHHWIDLLMAAFQ